MRREPGNEERVWEGGESLGRGRELVYITYTRDSFRGANWRVKKTGGLGIDVTSMVPAVYYNICLGSLREVVQIFQREVCSKISSRESFCNPKMSSRGRTILGEAISTMTSPSH